MIGSNLLKGSTGCYVFIDIKKAFDSVPHQTLLKKVCSLNIPFILHQWLTNYLRSRLQRVVLSGAISLWLPVKSDVPQGSVLGPCFFLSYINDLAFITFSHGTRILLFGDGNMLYKPVSNDQDTIDFQGDVDLVAYWAKLNHLELNSGKSKLMYITRSHVSQCPSILLQTGSGSPLQISQGYSCQITFLGEAYPLCY